MEFIDKDLHDLKSGEIRSIIKEFFKQTKIRVPPFSRAKKTKLIDIMRNFDIVKQLKIATNPNALKEELNNAIKEETKIVIKSTDVIDDKTELDYVLEEEKIPMPKLKRQSSVEKEPEVSPLTLEEKYKNEKKVSFMDDEKIQEITRVDILNSIKDIQYDIDYMFRNNHSKEEIVKLEHQLSLYKEFLKQKY